MAVVVSGVVVSGVVASGFSQTAVLILSWATVYITDQMWLYRHAFSKLPSKISLDVSANEALNEAASVGSDGEGASVQSASTVSESSVPKLAVEFADLPATSAAPVSAAGDSSLSGLSTADSSLTSSENGLASGKRPTISRRRRTSILFTLKQPPAAAASVRGLSVVAGTGAPDFPSPTPSSPSSGRGPFPHSPSPATSVSSSLRQVAAGATEAPSNESLARNSRGRGGDAGEAERQTALLRGAAQESGGLSLRQQPKQPGDDASKASGASALVGEGGLKDPSEMPQTLNTEAEDVTTQDHSHSEDTFDSVLTKAEEMMQITSLLMLLILTLTFPPAYAVSKFTPLW